MTVISESYSRGFAEALSLAQETPCWRKWTHFGREHGHSLENSLRLPRTPNVCKATWRDRTTDPRTPTVCEQVPSPGSRGLSKEEGKGPSSLLKSKATVLVFFFPFFFFFSFFYFSFQNERSPVEPTGPSPSEKGGSVSIPRTGHRNYCPRCAWGPGTEVTSASSRLGAR